MADALIFFTSLLAFALAARGLMLAVTQNIRIEAMVGGYSLRALRIGRVYKIVAWGLLALTLFGWMFYSFLVTLFE
jgi:hypothetical protein